MLLDVVCTPGEIALALAAQPGAACAVIDVVRATTTLTVLGERGAARVLVAGDVALARAVGAAHPAAALAGEVGGLAPPGFTFGNSPAQVGSADLAGREVVFATTNGTRAMALAREHGAGALYAAALRNAGAVADRALRHEAFLLLCAGLQGRLALDDLYAAGVIAGRIVQRAGALGVPLTLTEGAALAHDLAAGAGEPLAVLRRSQGGRNVLDLGLADDLDWCAASDATAIIPRMTGVTAEGALIFTFA